MLEVGVDVSEILKTGVRLKSAGKNMPTAIMRALNHTGRKTRTVMIRSLVKQTGLKRKTIVEALKKKGAAVGSPSFVIKSRGGDISLKYFKPRETRKGVSAAPWGKRRLYLGTFLKGGFYPDHRITLKMGGHVFNRVGKNRVPIELQKSGVVIPAEMISGATEAAFNATTERDLPKRFEHELARLIR